MYQFEKVTRTTTKTWTLSIFIFLIQLLLIILLTVNPVNPPPDITKDEASTGIALQPIVTMPTLRVYIEAPLTPEEIEYIQELSLYFGFSLDKPYGIIEACEQPLKATIIITK